MHRYCLTTILLLMASAAHAESPPAPAPALAPPPKWIIAAGDTATLIAGQDTQPAANVSITRVIGKGSVELSGTVSGTSNDHAPAGLLPERIVTLALTGTRQFGHLVLDGHVAAGWATFRQGILPVSPTTSALVSSQADGFGVGGGASLNISLAEYFILTPRVGIDYAATGVKRTPVDRIASPDEIETKSDGITLSGGAALQSRFGASHQHGFTAMATAMRMTNTSDFIHRTSRVNPVDIKQRSADTFIDYGVSLSLGLTHRLGIDISATRSAGINGPESTMIGAGLHVTF